MTASMIITLAVVILMIVVIIMDKLPFGAPALLAAALLVLLGQTDIATAFSGFTDKNVIMIMGFMVATAALQKTELMYRLKKWLAKIATTGGRKGFLFLLLAIMLVGNFITGTPFYVMVITLIATIPYNDELPPSKLVLPCVLDSSGWLPSAQAIYAGVAASLLESGGYTGEGIEMSKMCIIAAIFSAIYLVYAPIMSRFLPKRDISDSLDQEKVNDDGTFTPVLSRNQEKIVYAFYAVMLVVMFFLQKIPGDIGYIVPLVIAGVFLVTKVVSFKEFLNNMFSPVLIMMASIIGVAAAMSNCGLSSYLGSLVASGLGASPSLLLITMVFAFMTSLMSTFTGASFGSLFIFAPIGIALCMNYGYSPVPLAFACTLAAWTNFFMPIDGMSAMAMGVGKYKLTEFWMYTIPWWIIKMVLTCVLGVAFFG